MNQAIASVFGRGSDRQDGPAAAARPDAAPSHRGPSTHGCRRQCQYRGSMTNLPFGFSRPATTIRRSAGSGRASPGRRFRPRPARVDAVPARPDDVAGRRRRPGRSTTTWPGSWPPPRCRPSHPASSVDVKRGPGRVRAGRGLAGRRDRVAGRRPHRDRVDAAAVDRRDHADAGRSCAPRSPSGSPRPGSRACRSRPATQAGPLLAMMGSMGGMAFGCQLGQGLAQLAGEVLTSTDIGLPLGPDGTAALLPLAVAEFGTGLDLPEDQVRLYLAAREAAHHRLYAGRAVAQGPGAQPDRRLRAERSRSTSRRWRSSPPRSTRRTRRSIEAALGQGMFEPKITAGQQADAGRPGDPARTGRGLGGHGGRRRGRRSAAGRGGAAGDPAPAPGHRRSGGADLRHPDRPRAAARAGCAPRPTSGATSETSRGIEGRDALWAHPDLLPEQLGPGRPGTASSTATSSSASCWPGWTTSTASPTSRPPTLRSRRPKRRSGRHRRPRPGRPR